MIPPPLDYSSAPTNTTIVFDAREDGITIIDRPRGWLGRHSSSGIAAMLIVGAVTIVSADRLIIERDLLYAVVLALLWVVLVPLLINRLWRGRVPGIVEIVPRQLIHIGPSFAGHARRREWPVEQIARIVVVPQLWNFRLELVGELQILINEPARRSHFPRTIRALSGHRIDELEWVRRQLLQAIERTKQISIPADRDRPCDSDPHHPAP